MNSYQVKNAIHVIILGLVMGVVHSNLIPLAYGQVEDEKIEDEKIDPVPQSSSAPINDEHREAMKELPINHRIKYEITHNQELLNSWQTIKKNMGWIECSDTPDKESFGLLGALNNKRNARNAPIKMTLKYNCESLEHKFERKAKYWATYRDGDYDFSKYQLVFEDVYSKYKDNDLDSINYNMEKHKLKHSKREHIRQLVADNEMVRHHVEDLIYRNSLDCYAPTIRYPLVKAPMNKYVETPQNLFIETKCAMLGAQGWVAKLKIKVAYKLSALSGDNSNESTRIVVKKSQITVEKSRELGDKIPSQEQP
jgi:hypothetical protein